MDFNLTPEQEALRDSVTRFADRDYGWEQRNALVRAPSGTTTHWATFAELGWLGAGLPEDKGGFGGGAAENAVIMEALGKALVIEPLVAHVIATRLLAAAEPGQAAPLIEELVMGARRGVLAHDEGEVGAPIEAVLAEPDAAGARRLTAAKAVVLGGAEADYYLVSARDAARNGALCVCIVEREGEGVTVAPYRLVDNHRAADLGIDTVIAADRILSFPDGAEAAIEQAGDHGIVALCAEAVGAMEAAVWLTRDYLLTRKQFGVPLATFQVLQHRMADMLVATEMARSILFAAIGGVDDENADLRRQAVSAAKALIGRAGPEVAGAAIQLHGGIGMTEEYVVGHYYKRLFAIARLLGDGDAHLARFAAASDRPDRQGE